MIDTGLNEVWCLLNYENIVVLQRFDNGLAMKNRGFGFNGAIKKRCQNRGKWSAMFFLSNSADSSHTGFILVNFEFLDNTADGDNQDIGALHFLAARVCFCLGGRGARLVFDVWPIPVGSCWVDPCWAGEAPICCFGPTMLLALWARWVGHRASSWHVGLSKRGILPRKVVCDQNVAIAIFGYFSTSLGHPLFLSFLTLSTFNSSCYLWD